MCRADHRNVQHIDVIVFAHEEWRRKRDKVLRRNSGFLEQLSRCRLPWRLSPFALTTENLPDVTAASAGKPAVLINKKETGTSVSDVCDHRADCPGADGLAPTLCCLGPRS